jgi:beta-lactam-binding protein with PASTA domain
VYQQFAEDSVTVPDLSVFTNGSEMQAVLNHAGLKSAFGTPLPAPSKDEEFKVASQSPSAGARVSRGTVVTVTAYGGFAGAAPMPNLVGLTPDQVTVQLQGGGLVIASVDSTAPPPSPDQERRIYEQVPAAGEPVPADNRVTLRQYASTPQPPPGAEWSGTYVEPNSTIVLSGSAAGLSASFTYEVGAAKGSGSWTGCQVEGNTAKCNWTAAHEDETKSGTRSGTVQVTLDGNSITGSYTENEPVFSYKPGYSAASVVSSMHQGATWPINATRK